MMTRTTLLDAGHAAVASSTTGTRVAVSTVIFTLRRDADGSSDRRDPARPPHARPARGPVGASRRLARRRREPRRRGRPHARRDDGLAPSFLEQLYAFGAVDRSPSRVVSIVYWALLRDDESRSASPDHDAGERRRGSTRPPSPASPSTTTRSSTTPCGGCATRSATAASRTACSPTSSPSPNCARCTRRSSAGASTRRTSAGRSRTPATSSPPTASARAATARRGSTATTRTSSSPIAARSSATEPRRVSTPCPP